jgi:hypothetical protein
MRSAPPTVFQCEAKLGLNIPGPHDATAGLAGSNARAGNSRHEPVVTADPTATARDKGQAGTGREVSALARSTTLTGSDKGAAISGLASAGKSRAGQDVRPTDSTGKR